MILASQRVRLGVRCAVLGWMLTAPLSAQSLPDNPPFGEIATPVEGSTVSGVIPVTGWALDDNGGMTVKVFYQGTGGQNYVGPASFEEGSRPDVALAYPGLYGGGWRVMLLTSTLPNGGNGTYTLRAEAADAAGQTTDLGTRTFNCDNAYSDRPFGSIDTPQPGATVYGSNVMVHGWVLTPQPSIIPVDGSTIRMFMDGVLLGNPTYNIYRADIAALFPGYANSNGAAGMFLFDSTPYEDGVHTLQWVVNDDQGHSQGVGSRYFRIQNGPDAALTGNGIQIACGDTVPSGVDGTDFGITDADSLPIIRTFTVRNAGGSNLSLGEVRILPVEGEGFSVEQAPGDSLAAGESCTFKVRFTQGPTGMQRADVSMATNAAAANPLLFRVRANMVLDAGIAGRPGRPASRFSLSQNYPNPFNSCTVIRYDLPQQTRVELTVFDFSGRRVRILVRRLEPAGSHEVEWDGTDDRGIRPASGLYLCRLRSGDFVRTVKMMLMY